MEIGSYEHLKATNDLFNKFINSYLQTFQLNKVTDEKSKKNQYFFKQIIIICKNIFISKVNEENKFPNKQATKCVQDEKLENKNVTLNLIQF